MQGYFLMVHPRPCIAIIATSLMQGEELVITSNGLGAFYELMFSGWEQARERRWSFREIGGNLVSDSIHLFESTKRYLFGVIPLLTR